MSPLAQVRQALKRKGYREVSHYLVDARYGGPGTRAEGRCLSFTLFRRGGTILCLKVYRDGGCFLHRALLESTSLAATIAAIPEPE
jgi:hypothetical protein